MEASCDFEEDYCGYYNTKEGDEIDWERGKGRLYTSTGPSTDHTTLTALGYYAFINPIAPMKIGFFILNGNEFIFVYVTVNLLKQVTKHGL